MAVLKSNRYKVVKFLLENKGVKSFEEIFEILPRTRLALDTKIHYNRLGNKERNPDKFTVKDIRTIAKLLDIDPIILFSLILLIAEKKSLKTT